MLLVSGGFRRIRRIVSGQNSLSGNAHGPGRKAFNPTGCDFRLGSRLLFGNTGTTPVQGRCRRRANRGFHAIGPKGTCRPINGSGGAPISARGDLGRTRRQLRAVLGPRDEGRALPFRPRGNPGDRADRATRIYGRDLARLSAGRAPWDSLWLSGPWTVRTRRRTPVQPEQAADRPIRQAADRHSAMVGRSVRLQIEFTRQGPLVRRSR